MERLNIWKLKCEIFWIETKSAYSVINQYPRENTVTDALQTMIVIEQADGIHILLSSKMWISCWTSGLCEDIVKRSNKHDFSLYDSQVM